MREGEGPVWWDVGAPAASFWKWRQARRQPDRHRDRHRRIGKRGEPAAPGASPGSLGRRLRLGEKPKVSANRAGYLGPWNPFGAPEPPPPFVLPFSSEAAVGGRQDRWTRGQPDGMTSREVSLTPIRPRSPEAPRIARGPRTPRLPGAGGGGSRVDPAPDRPGPAPPARAARLRREEDTSRGQGPAT